jgi:DeoR/GlpR family transcriptional regulator of sugar metabolism
LPEYISEDLHITIISNSISFLCEASKVNCRNWLLVSLGGILNPKNLSLYGSETQKNAALYYPDKTIISCTGISSMNKITDLSPLEVEIKRMMIDRAQKVFLLADHTKFGQTGQVFICDFPAIDHIITDGPWEPQEKGLDFSAMGIDITVVEPE